MSSSDELSPVPQRLLEGRKAAEAAPSVTLAPATAVAPCNPLVNDDCSPPPPGIVKGKSGRVDDSDDDRSPPPRSLIQRLASSVAKKAVSDAGATSEAATSSTRRPAVYNTPVGDACSRSNTANAQAHSKRSSFAAPRWSSLSRKAHLRHQTGDTVASPVVNSSMYTCDDCDDDHPSLSGKTTGWSLLDNESEKTKMSKASIKNCLSFVCGDKRCPKHNCLSQVDELDVKKFRSDFNSQLSDGSGREQILVKELARAKIDAKPYFALIRVPAEDSERPGVDKMVPLCVAGYACAVAAVGFSTFKRARSNAKLSEDSRSSRAVDSQVVRAAKKVSAVRDVTRLLHSYVRELCTKMEHNPVPGAQREIEYSCDKDTWQNRCVACNNHFKAHNVDVGVVTRHQLTRAWRSMKHIVEKSQCSHAQCDLCAMLASESAALSGKTSPDDVRDRADLAEKKNDHKLFVAVERTELDDAGYAAIFYPDTTWTIIADAATQRNFELIRLRGRVPKELDNRANWRSKLFGTYAYGDGLRLMFVHESVATGANLCIHAVYCTLMEMVKKGRPLPCLIHLQLDNTTSENKNVHMIRFAGWLVANGWCKQVCNDTGVAQLVDISQPMITGAAVLPSEGSHSRHHRSSVWNRDKGRQRQDRPHNSSLVQRRHRCSQEVKEVHVSGYQKRPSYMGLEELSLSARNSIN